MSENNNNYNIGNADESIESLLSGKRRGVPQGGAGVPPRRDTSAARQYGAGTAGPYGSAPRRPSGERIQAPQSGAGMRIRENPPAKRTAPAAGRPAPVPPSGQTARSVPSGQRINAPRPAPSGAVPPRASEARPASGERIQTPHARVYQLPSEQQRSAAPSNMTNEVSKSLYVPNDDDIKLGGKKYRQTPEPTRVTDMSGVKVAGDGKKRAKSKKSVNKDDSSGGTVVSSLLKTVIYLVFVSVISVVLSIFIINVGNDVFAFVKSDELIDVTIPENATRDDIADILYENGVINYKAAFKLYGSIKHIEENFVAGDYTVNPMMNYKNLYNAFKEKPVMGTEWITIPEGYTVDEIIDLMLSYNIGGTKEDYVKAINEGDFSEFWFVKELEENGYDHNRFYRLEGYLFPDTYEFYKASDAYTVVRKMLKRFAEIYNEKYKARADELGLKTDEAVILASMIEKEAGLSSDFRYVSAVFHNRRNNAATFPCYASDATVVYAIAHDTGERPKEVTGEMMQYSSPYNTYTNAGFPPGAISNPCMNALKYALYPAEGTSYYYFVSFPNGETVFSSTEAEHNQYVAQLRAMQAGNN